TQSSHSSLYRSHINATTPIFTLSLHDALPILGADGVAPPDTNGSVGATQFVQIVNVEYAVYDKTSGALLLGPTPIHNIWSGFNGDCANGDGGDPVVLYDKAANRWVVGQMNVNLNAYCMAVSTTSDATQSYY